MHANKKPSYYLFFRNIHVVLKAEKRLKEQGIDFELIPIPRTLSSDCGSCIRVEGEIDMTLSCLNEIELEKCFFFDGSEYRAVQS